MLWNLNLLNKGTLKKCLFEYLSKLTVETPKLNIVIHNIVQIVSNRQNRKIPNWV